MLPVSMVMKVSRNFGGAGEAIGPALAGCGVEDGAVVVEGFGERDGVEDGDALP